MKLLNKYWLHAVIWATMILYFLFAPDLFVHFVLTAGRPLETKSVIPAESDRITFVVEDIESYLKQGENLLNLYGWSYILPKKGQSTTGFTREIVLSSDKKVYLFAVRPTYRSPGPQSTFMEAGVDLNTLGFNTLIAQDAIQTGKYRIGIIFRDPSTGDSFYWDKPARYLVKTPNTLRLEKK
jgi:hypothetical protein